MPSNPNHARNVQLAAKILKSQGLNPVCETADGQADEVNRLLHPMEEDEGDPNEEL